MMCDFIEIYVSSCWYNAQIMYAVGELAVINSTAMELKLHNQWRSVVRGHPRSGYLCVETLQYERSRVRSLFVCVECVCEFFF